MMSQVNSVPKSGLAEIARRGGLVDGRRQPAVRQVEFAADVDERVAHLQRVRGDQHRLDQQVRRVLEDPAILERARLALVGVRAKVVRLPVVEMHDRPFPARGERGAAAALDARRRDLACHVLRLHLPQHLLERRVAAARTVVGQRVRGRGDREGHQQLGHGRGRSHQVSRARRSSSVSTSTFS